MLIPPITERTQGADGAALARAEVWLLLVGLPTALAAYYLSGVKFVLYAIYAGAAMLLASSLRHVMAHRITRPVHRWYAALGTTLVLATAFALVRPDSAVDRNKMEALLLCLCWCGGIFSAYGAVLRAREYRSAYTALEVTGILLSSSVYAGAALWMVDITFGEVLEFDGAIRVFGPLGDQISFVLVLFVLTGVARGAWVLTAAHIGALLLTASRGAFGCLVVGLVMLNFLPGRVRCRAGGRLLPTIATVGVVVGLLLSPIGALLVERTLAEDPRTRYGGRLEAIDAGLAVVRQNPWTGVGFYGFEQARWRVYESAFVDPFTDRSFASAANQLVQTGTDGGVLALLILAGFSVTAVRAVWLNPLLRNPSDRPRLAGYAAWVIAILVANQSAPWLLPEATLGFFLMAVLGFLEAARVLRSAADPSDIGAPMPAPARRLVKLQPVRGRA